MLYGLASGTGTRAVTTLTDPFVAATLGASPDQTGPLAPHLGFSPLADHPKEPLIL